MLKAYLAGLTQTERASLIEDCAIDLRDLCIDQASIMTRVEKEPIQICNFEIQRLFLLFFVVGIWVIPIYLGFRAREVA